MISHQIEKGHETDTVRKTDYHQPSTHRVNYKGENVSGNICLGQSLLKAASKRENHLPI